MFKPIKKSKKRLTNDEIPNTFRPALTYCPYFNKYTRDTSLISTKRKSNSSFATTSPSSSSSSPPEPESKAETEVTRSYSDIANDFINLFDRNVALKDFSKLMDFCIEKDFPVSYTQTNSGRNLLHIAYAYGREDVANCLLEKGYHEQLEKADRFGFLPKDYQRKKETSNRNINQLG